MPGEIYYLEKVIFGYRQDKSNPADLGVGNVNQTKAEAKGLYLKLAGYGRRYILWTFLTLKTILHIVTNESSLSSRTILSLLHVHHDAFIRMYQFDTS